MMNSDFKNIQPIFYVLLLCAVVILFQVSVTWNLTNADANPSLTVSFSKQRYALKAPIEFQLTRKNIPHGYSFALFLLNDLRNNKGGVSDVWSPGCAGPLSGVTTRVNGNGLLSFGWDGSGTWWAPTDSPVKCTVILAGRYKIKVALYKSKDVPLLGRAGHRAAPVKTFLSRSFYLEGETDLSDLKRQFEYKLIDRLFTSNKLPNTIMNWEQLIITTKDVYKRKDGIHCMEQRAALIFLGTLEACTTVPVLSEAGLRYPAGIDFIKIKGNVVPAMGGLLTVHQAVRFARTVALEPYLENLGIGHAHEKYPAISIKNCEDNKWCRGSKYFATDNLTLRISITSWKYVPDYQRWNVYFHLTTTKNHKIIEDKAILVCVKNDGQTEISSDLSRGMTRVRAIEDIYFNSGYNCLKSQ